MGMSLSSSLHVKLEQAADEYSRKFWEDETQEKLLQVLQNNDCRKLVSKCVANDNLANAFVCSSRQNHIEILQSFLNKGISVDVKNRDDDTALIRASTTGHKGSVQLLLDHNANTDLQNYYGFTALMCASRYDHKEVVQLLLDHNVDTDLKTINGNTALDLATEEIKEMIQNHVNTSYVLK